MRTRDSHARDLLAVPSAYAVCGCPGRYDADMDWNGWRPGSLSSAVLDRVEPGRDPWSTPRSADGESYLAAGRSPVRERADLDARTDPLRLATAIMAAQRATTCSSRRPTPRG
jgi:hypothetical protein